MAFFLLRTISGLRVATLISVFRLSGQCLAYQDSVSSLAKIQVRSWRQHASSQHLPSTQCHCPDPPAPAAGDFFQVLGIFFQTETNLALLRLEVHMPPVPGKTLKPHPRLHVRVIPTVSFHLPFQVCFCPVGILFFFIQARLYI